ncbi:MAG: Cu(I)-responsive transcriptional regulator [Rhodocyclaceae bacterium]
MNIGEAAKASGLSAKMIRYYESIGLLPEAARSLSGYRRYGDGEVHTLRFIRHARDLGFGLEDVTLLVSLWHDRQRASREVKDLAQQHITSMEAKVAELNAMIATLRQLAECCHGDDRPDCPILEGIARNELA